MLIANTERLSEVIREQAALLREQAPNSVVLKCPAGHEVFVRYEVALISLRAIPSGQAT